MTYSRKGRLIFRGAMFAVVALWAAFVLLVHPSRSVVPYIAGMVLIVCLGLAIRAFLYLDEIERARRMRISFYGAMLGIWVATFVVLFMTVNPSALEILAGMVHRQRPHLPMDYFVAGVMVPIIAQCGCALLISLVTRLKSGA